MKIDKFNINADALFGLVAILSISFAWVVSLGSRYHLAGYPAEYEWVYGIGISAPLAASFVGLIELEDPIEVEIKATNSVEETISDLLNLVEFVFVYGFPLFVAYFTLLILSLSPYSDAFKDRENGDTE